MNKLILGLRYFFNLNRKVRGYLRFAIESFAILTIYMVWLASVDGYKEFNAATHILNAIVWAFTYKVFGLDRDRLRFSNLKSYTSVVKSSLAFSAVLSLQSVWHLGTLNTFSSFFLLLANLNTIIGLRVLARHLIRREFSNTRENILVYGTSDIAIDLANAMAFGKKYNVVGFISDLPKNIGSLAGLPVIEIDRVQHHANTYGCKLVVLADGTSGPPSQTEILQKLDQLGLSVSYAPTMDRAFDYEVQLKAVKPEDVLGHGSTILYDASVNDELRKKTILITGAGGSIGSEICRQVLHYEPTKVIAFELNEFALYQLEQELSSYMKEHKKLATVLYQLGSVNDGIILNKIFSENEIDIVYHAAAYKHVPIVEDNIIAGVQNNVFGTKTLADFADRFEVEKFVLVSTDKAVRPSNVMGASKRLAELIVQDFAKSSRTIFTMVRFGNVLGSSGSVIPKFKSQINSGGPITVTHGEITRYFMSISEAAHLVVNAGTLANGGEVFLLDMGDPVKILDLAQSMVRQHGLQPILPSENQQRQRRTNEIYIEFSGLRPGEKLYEELLVDGTADKTTNPKILKSHDGTVEVLDLSEALQLLEKHISENHSEAILACLRDLPLSYQPNAGEKPEGAISAKLGQAQSIIGATTGNRQSNVLPTTNLDRPSVLQKIISSRLGLAMLHRYFLITRGMTLGVRVLVKNHNDEVLLVKHTYVPGWHLPGGGVDHGEDVASAAKREIFEETGISELHDLKFISLKLNCAVSNRDHVSYFKARTSQDQLTKKNGEIAEIRFVEHDTALEIIHPEYREFIMENQ